MPGRNSLLAVAVTATLLAPPSWAAPGAATGLAARADLRDGSVLRGLLLGLDADSVTLRLAGRTTRLERSAVRALSFVADPDFWRERGRVASGTATVILLSGQALQAERLRYEAAVLQIEEPASGRSLQLAGDELRRIYLDPVGLDFRDPPGHERHTRSAAGSPEALARMALRARTLRSRLEGTAHRADPFESNAIGCLAALEQAAEELARLQSTERSSRDALFRATAWLAARAEETDAALDSLHAYESVRNDWARLRDAELDEALRQARVAVSASR